MATVRTIRSDHLTVPQLEGLRALFAEAWGDGPERFTEEDWEHTFGGVHFVVDEGDAIVAHASVVERDLRTGGRSLRTGYVEAVATASSHRGRGLGTAVMRAAGDHIDEVFELGALATEVTGFYERLGWRVWRGPLFVRTDAGDVRTPEEEGGVMVRVTPRSPALDLSAPLSCEWRPGDVW